MSIALIAKMTEAELRGAWWRLNDPVLREAAPEQPGERAAVIKRAAELRVRL